MSVEFSDLLYLKSLEMCVNGAIFCLCCQEEYYCVSITIMSMSLASAIVLSFSVNNYLVTRVTIIHSAPVLNTLA